MQMNNGAKVFWKNHLLIGPADEQMIEEGQASLDAYERSVLPHEGDEPIEKCPLCERTIWPDDPITLVQLSADDDMRDVHKLCGMELRIAKLEKKLSDLSYRVPV